MWVWLSSTGKVSFLKKNKKKNGKVSNGWIRKDLGFNFCLCQKLIYVLVW